MKFKLIILFTIFLFLTSCVTKIPLSKSYFNSDKKVGVILVKNNIANYKQGSQGLLDMALTPGNKYKEPLESVDKEITIIEKINNLYKSIYNSKGKELVVIDEKIDFDSLNKFLKPKKSKKKYYKYNIMYLKEKYDIDELLFVEVKYGVLVSYYGFIETGRFGYCQIASEIINLDDNSYLYKGISTSNEVIKGKWKNPPKYEELKTSIERAISKSIQMEKSKIK